MKPYVSLVVHDGALATVGMLEPISAEGIDFADVSSRRITIGESFIGSIAETQQVLDFGAEHDVTPDVEVIPIDQVNDVRFRYVIDNSTLRARRTGRNVWRSGNHAIPRAIRTDDYKEST